MASSIGKLIKWLVAAGLLSMVVKRYLRKKKDEEMMKKKGNGKTCVITGGASGVGKKAVELFGTKGWKVIAVDVNEQGLKKMQDEMKSRSIDVVTVSANLADEVSSIKGAESVFVALENKPLDCLVNCAAVTIPTPALDKAFHRLEWQVQVNLIGPVRLCNLLLPSLLKSASGGVIVNISSVAGTVAWPFQGLYSATKYGLEGFSDALRVESKACNLNLKVALIKPGPINTPMIEAQKDQTLRWMEESKESPFFGGFKETHDRHTQVPLDGKIGALMMVEPDAVAKAIYVTAVDQNPPARRLVCTPMFEGLYEFMKVLPTSLCDKFMGFV